MVLIEPQTITDQLKSIKTVLNLRKKITIIHFPNYFKNPKKNKLESNG